MKYKTSKNMRFRGLHEWQRTIILLILLFIGVGVVVWTNTNVANNFVDQFEELPEQSQAAVVEDPEEILEDFVRGPFIINGRISGFEDRFNNISFVVNANSEQDYSINELPDSGDPVIYVVRGQELFTRSGLGSWDEGTILEDSSLGYGATRFTPTNEEVNEAWKQTTLQAETVDCNLGECAVWQGATDSGDEIELQISQDGRIVKLSNTSTNGVSVVFDYTYTSEPDVESTPPALLR